MPYKTAFRKLNRGGIVVFGVVTTVFWDSNKHNQTVNFSDQLVAENLE